MDNIPSVSLKRDAQELLNEERNKERSFLVRRTASTPMVLPEREAVDLLAYRFQR